MNLVRLLTFSLCLTLVACSEITEFISQSSIVNSTELKLNAHEGLYYYQNEPFSGQAVSYYSNNQAETSISYSKGKKHGPSKKWFPSGKLSYQANYLEGKLDGELSTWWSNGNLRTKYQYAHGFASGVQWQWYRSGAKFKRINLVEGREEGLQKSWRENGKIYNNYEAKNGRIFGLKRSKLCFQLDGEEVQS